MVTSSFLAVQENDFYATIGTRPERAGVSLAPEASAIDGDADAMLGHVIRRMHPVAPRLLLNLGLIVGLAACGTKQEAQSTRQQLHVTVHLLRVTTAPSLTTQTSDADARALVAEMNRIWSAAKFSVVIDKVQNEEAIDDAAAIAWLTSSAGDEGPDALLANLLRIRPAVSNQATIHIYFIGTIPANGITMPPNAIFVQDNPRLRDVAGGAHDPRARVMAHELGHVFGLFHADEPDRLMFGGSTGTRVTDSETATAADFIRAQRRM